jgi:hypothetical protein
MTYFVTRYPYHKNMKANRREPISYYGQIFNLKSTCFVVGINGAKILSITIKMTVVMLSAVMLNVAKLH